MYRSSPARKYGPLAFLAVAHLIVALIAPSTAGLEGNDTLASAPGVAADGTALPEGATVAADGSIIAADGQVISGPGGLAAGGDAGAVPVADGAAAGGSAGAGGAAPVAAGAGGDAQPAGGASSGDTSHCKAGRQFDPALDFYAPPCVPGKPGAAVANGGATSQGVTADKIVVVNYIPEYGAEVEAVLRAQGLYYDANNARIANAAFQSFINKNHQLHGRKLDIKTFQGGCRTVPPDEQCLNAEMNRIAKEFKPFAVYFQGTICSACFAELARNKIVSFGGAGFSDEFRSALRPYNFDYGMSATRMAKLFAQWWCSSLAKKPAIHAGSQNPSQDFRKVKRQLGVVSTNDPDNERVIKRVLYPELAKCGESVDGHEYFYEGNVSTAAQQSQAGLAKMNTPQNPATSIVCFCDPVAPQFFLNAAARANYWPEVLYAANQGMDLDPSGQSYMEGLSCPNGGQGCTFDGAFGIGQNEKGIPEAQFTGVQIFKKESTDAAPLPALVLDFFWQNYNMFASLVQMAGPNLTPNTLAAAAPKLGARGGGASGKPLRAFVGGSQNWVQDVQISYWSKRRASGQNGRPGSYLPAYPGKRFGLDQMPGGDAPIPTPDKRS